ncbi:carbon-nitrogen hydrolase family protein [Iamia sp. SCSIO 61187]|uniref:carbon-nitrogen hydrolase family protein n=1 Tax=Iamia sp. SCSIO 61187 TaxID=2722752 RepID=UPI002103FE60|nr:carbon-nitrogen hydrolase family protein [Iamia sp. SCSIO 61187]QYG93924.1 carbon-nitrogen hydrolase family protein [Iamia sp. SCSIO 61187]
MATLRVATCQFPVSSDVDANHAWVRRQIETAVERGADVAHFPEGALSGYAGTDFASFDGFEWDRLRDAADQVRALARQLGVWVVVGSAHRLRPPHKPHNSVYVINGAGDVVDRYDKRFCSGDPDGRSGDLAHYAPGDHHSTWDINGITCGALICHDYRYPELYRAYKRHGVDVVFHSFHAANAPREQVEAIGAAIGPALRTLNPAPTFTYPGLTMPATMTAAAASSHVWISCSNSSARESMWPAFFLRADGITIGRLRRNAPGVLVSTVDTEQEIYDSTASWRDRAMEGFLHSGTLPRDDDRSANRTAL